MIAAGVDIGGTKIEAQIFASDWQAIDKHRISTPDTYDALIDAIGGMINWIDAKTPGLPTGIASAGLINQVTGLALTANLPATGKPFLRDIINRVGHPVTFLNDCRAFALSEAQFGAAKGASRMVGLILGTGVAGGLAIDGALVGGVGTLSGEFGHTPAPAHLVAKYDLPIVACGCGRTGCIETLISGPGLERLAGALTGQDMTTHAIAVGRGKDPQVDRVWAVWCALVAELLLSITLTIDPHMIVLGGGLSGISGVERDLAAALKSAQFKGFPVPEIRLAEGGDASGARGAAFAAWQEVQGG